VSFFHVEGAPAVDIKIALIPLVALLAGCASTPWDGYWQKPTKYKEMPKDGSDPTVATLSLDASRRLVISQEINPDRFTCPEPPPDVSMNTLDQVLASLQTKDGSGGTYGASSQAISQVLSARTAAVEIWRTTSSTYCVLLMNGRPAEAASYLAAATNVVAGVNQSSASAHVAGAFIDGVTGARAAIDKQQQAADEAKKAEDAKRAEATKAAEAKAADAAKKDAAKAKCALVPEGEKANSADCKLANS